MGGSQRELGRSIELTGATGPGPATRRPSHPQARPPARPVTGDAYRSRAITVSNGCSAASERLASITTRPVRPSSTIVEIALP
jgi:hypothetical protein